MNEIAKVSVIIPCYKCSKTIARAVCSVARQTLIPYEVILVDDSSGDSTLEILHAIRKDYEEGWIKVISAAANGGAGTARNIGWNAATQTYVAFLDSDDTWHEQKLAIQYNWMLKNPDVAMSGHAWQYPDESLSGGKFVQFGDDCLFFEINKNRLLRSNPFPTPSVMLLRNIKPRFIDGKRYCEDYQLWLNICCADLKCYYSNTPLTYIHKAVYGESGLSSDLWRMQKGEMETYRSVYIDANITFVHLSSLYAWSLFKFSIRVLKSYVIKIGRAM